MSRWQPLLASSKSVQYGTQIDSLGFHSQPQSHGVNNSVFLLMHLIKSILCGGMFSKHLDTFMNICSLDSLTSSTCIGVLSACQFFEGWHQRRLQWKLIWLLGHFNEDICNFWHSLPSWPRSFLACVSWMMKIMTQNLRETLAEQDILGAQTDCRCLGCRPTPYLIYSSDNPKSFKLLNMDIAVATTRLEGRQSCGPAELHV